MPLSIYVPIDDYYTMHFGLQWHPTEAMPGSRFPTPELPDEPGVLSQNQGPWKPEQKGTFYANWWPAISPETDFHMDLWAKKNKNFTGIPSVRQQDAAIEWSMGAIMDRTKEHLGTAGRQHHPGAAATAVGGAGAGRGRHATPGRRNA